MRWSFVLGVLLFAIGFGFSYLAYSLDLSIASRMGVATSIAAFFYVLFSSVFLGYGVALLLHWLFEFTGSMRAFFGQVIFAIALFFAGVGASIMSGEMFLGLHVFFTFATAGIGLLCLSFTTVFGTVGRGFFVLGKYLAARRWIKNL